MFRVNADTLETYVDFDFSFVRFDDLNLATVSALLAEADQIFNTDHRKRIPTKGRGIRGRAPDPPTGSPPMAGAASLSR